MFFKNRFDPKLYMLYLSEMGIDLQQTGKKAMNPKIDVIFKIHKDSGSTRKRLYCRSQPLHQQKGEPEPVQPPPKSAPE